MIIFKSILEVILKSNVDNYLWQIIPSNIAIPNEAIVFNTKKVPARGQTCFYQIVLYHLLSKVCIDYLPLHDSSSSITIGYQHAENLALPRLMVTRFFCFIIVFIDNSSLSSLSFPMNIYCIIFHFSNQKLFVWQLALAILGTDHLTGMILPHQRNVFR